MTVLLTRKSILQAAMEVTYNDAASVGVSDGVLVSNPMYSITPNVLQRDFTRNDLSPLPIIIGRKLAKMEFETEFRGNGKQNSGLASDAAIITRLFRASGYLLTANNDPVIKGPFAVGDEATEVVWALSSATKATDAYTIVTSDNVADGETVTIGTKVYTFKTALTNTDGFVLVGADGATSLVNLKNAINLGTGAGTTYAAATTLNAQVSAASTGLVLTVTAKTAGTASNSIAATTTAAHGSWGTATLAGGVNAASNTDVIAYYLAVTTPGASGTAHITVTSDTLGEGSASTAVTSGTPFSLGTKGLTITPTFSGSLVDGQMWAVWLMPAGLSLDPISDNFESITLVMHKDGVRHLMPGSFGTFEVTAQSGDFAKIKWTFTGTYQAPTDDANPEPDFETTLPSQVQLARLTIDQFEAIVDKFTFNQANDIQVRPDVSSSDGFIGTRIVNRKPVGGINPEADLVANYDFWGNFTVAKRMPFQMRIGTVAGNTIWVVAPNTQYTGLTYTDRSGIMAYDAGLQVSRSVGNDEICWYFC